MQMWCQCRFFLLHVYWSISDAFDLRMHQNGTTLQFSYDRNSCYLHSSLNNLNRDQFIFDLYHVSACNNRAYISIENGGQGILIDSRCWLLNIGCSYVPGNIEHDLLIIYSRWRKALFLAMQHGDEIWLLRIRFFCIQRINTFVLHATSTICL